MSADWLSSFHLPGYLIGSHDYYSHNTTYTREGVIDVGYDLYDNEEPASRDYDDVHSTLMFTKKSEEIIANHDQTKVGDE